MFSIFQLLDPLYWMVVMPTVFLALWAQLKVKSAYHRYSQVRTRRGYTGAQAAATVLNEAGIHDCDIEVTQGWLSDHYDPTSKTLRLSPDVYHGNSIASVGIAAHEAGHAIQHARKYAMLDVRSALVPVVGFGSWLAWPMIFLGAFVNSLGLVKLGIVLFTGLVIFQIVTLPVEFDATARAKRALADSGIVQRGEESDGVSAVLYAAAMTYVAATISAIAQLLYFLLKFGLLGRSSSND